MTTFLELTKMQDEASLKLKTEKMMFSKEEISKIEMIVINYGAINKVYNPIWTEMVHIIDRYPKQFNKYECIVMWLDSQYGLAKFYPEIARKIAIEVAGLKEVKI